MAAAKKTAASKPVEAEATEAPIRFDHAGITFTVPAPLDYPLDILEAESEVEIVRLVLGAEQWATYKATRPTIRDFKELSDKLNGSTGN
jgi:hypothetical protein